MERKYTPHELWDINARQTAEERNEIAESNQKGENMGKTIEEMNLTELKQLKLEINKNKKERK